MREFCTYGSAGEASGNRRLYPELSVIFLNPWGANCRFLSVKGLSKEPGKTVP